MKHLQSSLGTSSGGSLFFFRRIAYENACSCRARNGEVLTSTRHINQRTGPFSGRDVLGTIKAWQKAASRNEKPQLSSISSEWHSPFFAFAFSGRDASKKAAKVARFVSITQSKIDGSQMSNVLQGNTTNFQMYLPKKKWTPVSANDFRPSLDVKFNKYQSSSSPRNGNLIFCAGIKWLGGGGNIKCNQRLFTLRSSVTII